MKTFILPASLLIAICSPAAAQTVNLKGEAAEKFIRTYFPEAPIPGAFDGTFKCYVPAMGARGNGEVSHCTLRGHG